MIGEEASPSRFERTVLAIPDGAILRTIFLSIVGLTGWVLAQDLLAIQRGEADAARLTRTEPLPVRRPIPGDQIRPYLPRTVPVGPDRGIPRLPGFDDPVEGEAMGRPMTFVREGDDISAVGRIDPGTAGLLEAFLEGEGAGATRLNLHSPGGSVRDAIAMARTVREAGLDTLVPDDGYCASACPLFFAGGVTRAAGANAWVGLHQVYAVDIPGVDAVPDVGRSISDIQATIADCQQLLTEMGVDPAVWQHALRTPPEELYVLTAEEMDEFAMVQPGSGETSPPAGLPAG